MATKYNKAEIDALNQKFDHPESNVICPRCGKNLQFENGKWSSTVKCVTPNCIHGSIRGI